MRERELVERNQKKAASKINEIMKDMAYPSLPKEEKEVRRRYEEWR